MYLSIEHITLSVYCLHCRYLIQQFLQVDIPRMRVVNRLHIKTEEFSVSVLLLLYPVEYAVVYVR